MRYILKMPHPGFGISGHVRPFAETNIYKDACTKAQALWEHLKDEPVGQQTMP